MFDYKPKQYKVGGASLQLPPIRPLVRPLPNLVTTTPPKRLNRLRCYFQDIFLKVSSCASVKNFIVHGQYAAVRNHTHR